MEPIQDPFGKANTGTDNKPSTEQLKAQLRQLVEETLLAQGFTYSNGIICPAVQDPSRVQNTDKDNMRLLHESSRLTELAEHVKFLSSNWVLLSYLANGSEVVPERIQPKLVPADSGVEALIFKFFRLIHWSLPYSKGYGRRLKYLVIDEHNGKLIGLIGLQSPPISIQARDRLYSYPEGKKVEMVNQSMDIYTLGAVPPYTFLLGGKLVAYAAACNEIRQDYESRYNDRVTLINRQNIPARLVFLTTTSAYGRSSQYQRLVYRGEPVATSIGYTSGSGTFHFPTPVYHKVKELLGALGLDTATGFGEGWQKGPRRRLQQISRALSIVGLDPKLVYHGIPREVFLYPLIRNLSEYLSGKTIIPDYFDRPFADLASWWKERWCLPRSTRNQSWTEFDASKYAEEAVRLMQRATDAWN